ncbi:hypothetical protein EDB19DRAFT_1974697 [Suillus lakei]|nr:hypothetical protein EDB19DRAFT_1974697 [Suillus lakei]
MACSQCIGSSRIAHELDDRDNRNDCSPTDDSPPWANKPTALQDIADEMFGKVKMAAHTITGQKFAMKYKPASCVTMKTLLRMCRDSLVRMCETRDLGVPGMKPQLARSLLQWRDQRASSPHPPPRKGRLIPPDNHTKLGGIEIGDFNHVFIGKFKGRRVVIVEFRDQLNSMDIKELKLLDGFDHPNIIRFLGVSIPGNARETGIMVYSVFYMAQALITLQWNRLSDHADRKPVILPGLFGISAFTFLFGPSEA